MCVSNTLLCCGWYSKDINIIKIIALATKFIGLILYFVYLLFIYIVDI